MITPEQTSLIDMFETARPANALFCHQDFLEKLALHSHDSVGKRAAFLLQRLAVDSTRLHYKATHGANRGWRRSRLGGNRSEPRSFEPLKRQTRVAGTAVVHEGGEADHLQGNHGGHA